ncbi:hypothetical protein EYF80_002358 [Liparis tanakae]|uniref:Uncharacterized protein n=1 Tax=Liparis tanakae TaxID=230148 RepID=A0A4Z2JAG5_9TELE|nr:hypothetical protein EYF80_002358 [Liparis tanakae]
MYPCQNTKTMCKVFLSRSDRRWVLGSGTPHGVSNGTCACGTAPPVEPGTESNSLLCCRRKSIIFTATCLPLCFSVAIHTTPVEPSPIFTKFSSAALNCSWVTFGGSGGGLGEGCCGGLKAGEHVPGGLVAREPVGEGRGWEGLSCRG